MKLTTKFTLIFSSIILFMGYISFYGIYRFQYQILEQDITDKLENAAEGSLEGLDRMLYERLKDLEIASENPAFRSGGKAVKQALDEFLAKYPQYASVTYFTLNRNIVASAGENHGTFWQHPLTEYWPEIYAGKDEAVNISRSAMLDVPTLHFAMRVKGPAGKTLGVLVARIPANELYGLMESRAEPARGAANYGVNILDRDGTILFSNHNPDAVLNAIDEDFDLIRQALPSMHSVSSLTEIHDVLHAGEARALMVIAKEPGYRGFKGNGWILKMTYPVDQAFAPVVRLSRQVFLFLLSISGLGIAAILSVLLVTVVRPIKKLNKATTLLGEGKLDTRVAAGAPDEIGALAQSFNTMAANLKEAREQLARAAETALARASLAERKIIEISEETQRQIGRELHDNLGQQLTGVAFMSKVLHQHLKNEGHPEAEDAAKITSLLNDAIAKTQNLAHDLHPVEMDEPGLSAMLMRLAANTQSIFGIKCELLCRDEPRIGDPMIRTNVFRIAQEAVHNAVKHANATRITLTLSAAQGTLALEIIDNGRGLDKGEDTEDGRGLGMHTMRYRTSVMDAALQIGSMPGGGTRVALTLPLRGRSLAPPARAGKGQTDLEPDAG